jgi:hypothetical protein
MNMITKTERILRRLKPAGVIKVDSLAMQRRLIDVWRKICSRPKAKSKRKLI